MNLLADRADQLRAAEAEHARLQELVRGASIRIREHLSVDDILREAATVIQAELASDFVWVSLVEGDRITVTEGTTSAAQETGHDVHGPDPAPVR